jgi:DMSO/TMAO reductase YedYZ molybdopterin-dependent catalytic subunit
MPIKTSRRGLIFGSAATLASLSLAGCERLNRAASFQELLARGEVLTKTSQRLLLSHQPLAREFSPEHINAPFKANGTQLPHTDMYKAWQASNFATWSLLVDGLVSRPARFSLSKLEAMPSRTQITRHDCVEGWSAIGQWTGTPLSAVLSQVGLKPEARFIVFHCADNYTNKMGTQPDYYESIDLFDALHPQTILAYRLNNKPLPIANGAPLRARIERQLGYKHAKYLYRIEVVASLANIGKGKGGYWPDRGYEWYAGI